jgi:hypothetical protein
MDCVFCDHYSDGYIYHDDDGEWRWDQRHNWDDIWCQSRGGNCDCYSFYHRRLVRVVGGESGSWYS